MRTQNHINDVRNQTWAGTQAVHADPKTAVMVGVAVRYLGHENLVWKVAGELGTVEKCLHLRTDVRVHMLCF